MKNSQALEVCPKLHFIAVSEKEDYLRRQNLCSGNRRVLRKLYEAPISYTLAQKIKKEFEHPYMIDIYIVFNCS